MARSGRILVVDDDANQRGALAEILADSGFRVETAADASKAIEACKAFDPQVVVSDLHMPGMDGIELVKKLRAGDDAPAVIIATAFGDVATAVEAMRAGAAEYVLKPIHVDELLVFLDKIFERQQLQRESRRLRARVRERVAPGNIVGSSEPMQRVFEVVDQVAPSKATVLITGESGTGKELIASAVHQRSPRAHGPFIKVHCAALAETLLESELFGHEKGAYTGADARREGRFELAHGGTLFLDEIGEISPSIQVKLLRFLQEHELERVGGTQTIKVDVRVVAATNRVLADMVAQGKFREDLFYRLNVVAIEMPPLRARRGDIAALAQLFLQRYAEENGKPIEAFAPATLEVMTAYDWPGNVRELENAVERAVVLASGTQIEPRELPAKLRPASPVAGLPQIPGAKMDDIEKYAILETLAAVGGSTSKAAEMLGISVRTVQYRLHQYQGAPRSDVDVVKKRDDPESDE